MTSFELPLFPLNTVLFPGMPLQLHIFEERYKQMINRCIQEGQPFGVVLIRKGMEAQGPLAEPYPTGTTARITQVQKLSQGRMNIMTVGAERFRVTAFDYATRPYLAGSADLFPLTGQDRIAEPASAALHALLLEYLENLARLSEIAFEAGQIPVQPVELSYLTAIALQIPETNKQEILEVASAPELVEFLQARLRRELALLDVLAQKRNLKAIGSFSAN